MKRAFLFGAGAELDFGLSGGADFAKKILLAKETEMVEINKAIKAYYKGKRATLDAWYPTYAAEGWNETQLVRAALRKRSLDAGVKLKPDILVAEVKRIMDPMNSAEKENLLSKNTSYMGLADERYHTLIEPLTLGPKNFWSVINCYTRAYLLIVGQMLGLVNGVAKSDDYLNLLMNPSETYEKIVSIAKSKHDTESYYKAVREFAPGSLVITTNYTPFAEMVTEQDTINIHGDFSLFESARELRVYDVKEKGMILPETEVLFPYIAIQGGVKPVIERKQMSLYGNMVSALANSVDELVIVGYRINPDDNHLNSIIRSFLVEDKKKVIYFDYGSGNEEDIRRRLRLTISEASGLTYIPLNRTETIVKFQNFLKTSK